ncbi:ferrochelatase [Zophobihabitans entericus]|mgnify:CR=1 FL=1|uniref:Ferrochelatase n=1 Tax=Zophobihabitans entericus TaxID=1635327 RepID=A0A6G9IDG5_9GAMM|nr:ferrochelatase [Zophobihabitans entericus]QIQ22275.1 ferrochelatase [Zophobihabitans entericus]
MIKQNIGILLVNLGTPDAPTPQAIKPYLSEFLSDRHVVDVSPIIWWPLLRFIIIPKRIKHITQRYASIWTEQGSPLLKYSRSLCEKLSQKYPDKQIELAMTYGNPDLQQALEKLKQCDVIKVLPLYPQFSTTTTDAVIDKVKALTTTWSQKPEFEFVRDYADHIAYINGLCQHIEQAFTLHGKPDTLLFSYHGIPESYIRDRKDNYVDRCELTTLLVNSALQAKGVQVDVQMSYQSRFGKAKWVEPDTTPTLIELAKQGKQHIQVICPGFAVDCIETLDEIDELNRQEFLQAGGKQFYYIPALNDSPEQVSLMAELLNL